MMLNKQYEVVNEDGTIEKWRMERDVTELKSRNLSRYNSF